MSDSPKLFIAHPGPDGRADQTVADHLAGVSELSGSFAAKIGLKPIGELLGLLHDLGKYSKSFQQYIGSASGRIDPDADEYVDAAQLKGKIDHSTAGAQLVWRELAQRGPEATVVGQILALCLASHHSGLINCVAPDSDSDTQSNFERRMAKPFDQTHLDEVRAAADDEILFRIEALLSDEGIVSKTVEHLRSIAAHEREIGPKGGSNDRADFKFGLFTRLLFSCLIDADRIDSANFENLKLDSHRSYGAYIGWDTLIDRLEKHLSSFECQHGIGAIRKEISDRCLARAQDAQGIFTLTVPTGGGKTLASLRFALHHAKRHLLDRIIYVTPFTSIIDQNASVVRSILEFQGRDPFGSVVLEHHSNLTPEHQHWRAKLLSEDWDAPVVFTTSVQLLDTLFSGGTRSVRRLHQLTRSVVIFDEIQTLPVRCAHIFCNALNYLSSHCSTSIVLCTATQPLLGDLPNPEKGALQLSSKQELMSDLSQLFRNLKRVEVIDRTVPGGWTVDQVAAFASEQAHDSGSALVIVNTKAAATAVFNALKKVETSRLFHLSTSMCPVHRMHVLEEVKSLLGRSRFVCVSTQLIEAGVDIDFGTVIRYVAGLDSIAQAAGRCNRNGLRPVGHVYVLNPSDENVDSLVDIKCGKEKTERLLGELKRGLLGPDPDLLSPESMKLYFQYYFFDPARAATMSYPVSAAQLGRDDTLFRLLSSNSFSKGSLAFRGALRHAFYSAGEAFAAIDSPTRGIVVPYTSEGRQLIAKLCGAFELKKDFALLKKAQRFSVNVFPHVLKRLTNDGAIREVQEGTGVLYLDERYYSNEFGLSENAVTELEAQLC